MSSIDVRASVDGLGPLLTRVKALRKGTNRILRPAGRKGIAIVNRAAKAKLKPAKGGKRTRERHRILEKSIGTREVTYHNGVIEWFCGPRHGFKAAVGTKRDGSTVYEDPVNIAHLVENGHGGPKPAEPHPYMRPAWEEHRSEVRDVMKDEVAKRLNDAARG